MEKLQENEIGNIASMLLIRNDAETILSLMETEKDSIFSIGILPYYALFCSSCSDYIKCDINNGVIQKRIWDIRNYLKFLSNKFTKITNEIHKIDNKQDESFRNQIKWSPLRDLNIHYNLGVHFSSDKKIVANTSSVANCLKLDDVFCNKQKNKRKHIEIGEELGEFVKGVSNAYKSKLFAPNIERNNKHIKIPYYFDLNTNRESRFLNSKNQKEINLFCIYLISNINFVNSVLETLVPIGNTWVFRVKYIVNYYTIRALDAYKKYCEHNKCDNCFDGELDEILSYAEPYFDSKFRSCMMHYGISDEIKKEFFNMNVPLFGLVESCFNGMDFYSFYEKQDTISKMIIKCLEKQFDINAINLKEL